MKRKKKKRKKNLKINNKKKTTSVKKQGELQPETSTDFNGMLCSTLM